MTKKLLLIVFFIALVVRVWGTNPGYPPYHPDEPQVYSRALLILQGKEVDLGYWGYPALVPLINAVSYLVFFIPINLFLKLLDNPDVLFNSNFVLGDFLNTQVYGVKQVNVLFWGRAVNALMGSLTVVFTFILGEKLFGKRVGFVAALLLTLNLKHILSSHFALVDIANGLFLLLTIISALGLFDQNSNKKTFISAVVSGLSTSVKLSPFALAAPITALLLRFFMAKKKVLVKVALQLGILFAIFIVTVLLVNVFHLFHFEDLQKDFDTLNRRYAVGSYKLVPFPYFNFFTEALPFYISLFSCVGLFVMLVKKTKQTLVILAPVVLFVFALTFYSVGGVYSRNLVALIPLFVIFAAVGVTTLVKKDYLLWPLVVLMLLIPASKILAVNQAYSKPWNMDLVKAEFASKYDGKKVAATAWFASYIANPKIEFKNFSMAEDFTRRELEKLGIEYVLVDTDAFQHALVFWMSFRGREAIWSTEADDQVNSTFAMAAMKDLLAFRTLDIVKPIDAPETNFFVVKLPNFHKNFLGEAMLIEDFEKDPQWEIEGSYGQTIPNTGFVTDNECQSLGCMKLGHIGQVDSTISYLVSSGTPRFFSLTSQPIKVDSEHIYRVSANAWTSGSKETNRDGFLKVELHSDLIQAKSQKPTKLVFVSNRHQGKSMQKVLVDVYFYIPDGYEYMTVSFQRDGNKPEDFYFDNLKVEKSKNKSDSVEYKDFPEEYVVPKSIF